MVLEFARQILDVFQEGIVVSDSKGIILVSNARYSEVSAIPGREIVGKPAVQLVERGIFDLVLNPEIVRSGHSALRVQQVSNGRRLVLDGHPVLGESGEVRLVVTFIRDSACLGGVQAHVAAQRALLDSLAQSPSRQRVLEYEFQSTGMRQLHEMAHTVAATDATVLLLGETGAGKGVLARRIHAASHRAAQPFVTVDCGSIPQSLIEAELFGYAPGTFSGAQREGRRGLLESAHGGTVFLDEVGELPLAMQTRLLRVLQDKEVQRLGETRSRCVDVRIVAATNRNLEALMAQGVFRRDLYYRLKVAVLEVPPLRRQRADIIPLARLFLHYYCQKYGRQMHLSSEAERVLLAHGWAGNVRELENLMQSVSVRHRDVLVRPRDLWPHSGEAAEDSPEALPLAEGGLSYKEAVENFEYQLLSEAMQRYGSLSLAARHLCMDRSTLFRKLKALEAQGYPRHSPGRGERAVGRKRGRRSS